MKIMIVLACLVPACSDSSGTAHVTVWGEEAATQGYPNEELSFIDGWTLHFDHWITSLSNIELADPKSEAPVFTDATPYLVDLTRAVDPQVIVDVPLATQRYKFSYSFVPATAGATPLNDVDPSLASRMVANHWNTYFEATATKGATTVAIAWGMANAARYAYCTNGVDGTDGIAVPDGGTVDAGIFIHLDHTFWDRLGTEESKLRFDAIAAWAVNGETSLDDLAHVSIANVRDPSGTTMTDEKSRPLVYDDAGLGLPKLKDFVIFSTAQQGHLNGEGECVVVPLN